MDSTGGGVAVVSRLLWTVFQQRWGRRAQLLTAIEGTSHPATFIEKARFTLSLARAQALGRTDWILFSHLGLAQSQFAIPKALRRPYGVFLHGIEVWRPLGSSERQALAGADLRIANSQYTADRVLEMHPDVGAVDVCPLALLTARDPGRAPTGGSPALSLGPRAVLVVGRLMASERYKGHDQLIDAWPLVLAAVPDAQLVIVGDGDDLPRLKHKAAAGSASHAILFGGFVDRPTLDGLYERAALFALPSRGEGFGLVYLEAMAHRLACVGSIHDAAREVIADGETGRLVDQHDITGIVGTLTALLRNDDQRRRMGEAGFDRLQCEFSFERFSRRICDVLRVDRPAAAVTGA